MLLIPSAQRQIKCIIDLRNPSICSYSLSREGARFQAYNRTGSTISFFLLLSFPLFSVKLAGVTAAGDGHRGVASLGRNLWHISAGLDLAQTKDMAFLINDPQAVPH